METDKFYRRNNNGKPTVWWAYIIDNFVYCNYGQLGKTIRTERYLITKKNAENELKSRINDKVKAGYITLKEVVDESNQIPVEDITSPILKAYLDHYLPTNLSNSNNDVLLPMLAKTYTGKVWNKEAVMFGQYKINGLRCFIRAKRNQGDIFKPYSLIFQSREGIIWNTLGNLEEYLLNTLDEDFIIKLIDEDIVLDGELYLPGYYVNEINHFVKDDKSIENKLLQYWCYDVAIEDYSQCSRDSFRLNNLYNFIFKATDKNTHLNNKNRFVILNSVDVSSDAQAIMYRNKFINLGFEGLILRNPNTEYQFGRRRVGFMEKFKLATEGDFKIIDIYREDKRNLPILLCRNDINDETFETRLSDTHEIQQEVLENKSAYIGKFIHCDFGERSGINKVPFHIKSVEIIK